MIRLLFLISTLSRGGAERQLTLLVQSLDRTRFAVTVVTIYGEGALRGEIEGLDGVRILSLRKRGRWDVVRPVWRLMRLLRQERPDIVHGYMDVSNVLSLLGRFAGSRVVWGIRSANVDFSFYDRRAAWVYRLAGSLSRFSDLIVVNSHAGKRHHVRQGYCGERMIVIPNGFDTEQFHPDASAGRTMRRAWCVREEERLIGLVARLDPIKDHITFLRAASLLAQRRRDVRFVCVGDGPAAYRAELQAIAEQCGLAGRLLWAGEMDDMHAVHNALDIATSSSLSEGFPNTVGEAMACGVPCVVTDVGDSAVLVGPAGQVVPAAAPEAMAAAWTRLLELSADERVSLAEAARSRIVAEYSIQQLARRTEASVASLVAGAGDARPITSE